MAAAGFAVFGDDLMAWKAYGLLYIFGIALAGWAVLRRTGGAVAAAAFPALLAVSPLLVKDSLITPAGHHSSGVFYALLAVALALGGSGPARPGRALLAGVTLGFAAFYMRTSVVVGPAILLALAPAGKRSVAAFLAGCWAFPALAALNALGIDRASAHPGSDFRQIYEALMWSPRATPTEAPLAAKVAEAFGWPVRHLLFAQVKDPIAGDFPNRAVYDVAATVLAWSWLLALPALAAAAAAARKFRGSWVVALIAAGYLAAYALSPFRFEPSVIAGAGGDPDFIAVRYAVPAWIALTMVLAQGIGVLAQRSRRAAVGLAAVLLLPGLGAAHADLFLDADPPGTWQTLPPYRYEGMFGPHRGPWIYSHWNCPTRDPISRANHLRSGGAMVAPPPTRAADDPRTVLVIVSDTTQEQGLSAAERPFVAQGIGTALGYRYGGNDVLSNRQEIAAVLASANEMPRRDADAFLHGFRGGSPFEEFDPEDGGFVTTLCQPTVWGTFPLCRAVGWFLLESEWPGVAPTPAEMLHQPLPPEVPAEALPDVYYGAGEQFARRWPWLDLETQNLDAWPPELAAAFLAGARTRQIRSRWGPDDAWLPELVP